MAFKPSIICEIITIDIGTTIPNKARKNTKGLTQLFNSIAKVRFFFSILNFFHQISYNLYGADPLAFAFFASFSIPNDLNDEPPQINFQYS